MLKSPHSSCSWGLLRIPLYQCDVFMMQTYFCQCLPHLRLPLWLVSWQLWDFSDPFYQMSARVPWEKFCIIEQAELEMPQGSFRHELDYPWGLLSVLDVAVGKTDNQDELMNTILMSAKNNMKDDQNHALFCNQLTSSWEITSKECTVYLESYASPSKRKTKGLNKQGSCKGLWTTRVLSTNMHVN